MAIVLPTVVCLARMVPTIGGIQALLWLPVKENQPSDARTRRALLTNYTTRQLLAPCDGERLMPAPKKKVCVRQHCRGYLRYIRHMDLSGNGGAVYVRFILLIWP